MCQYLDSEYCLPGWGCCRCHTYNGIRRVACRNCGAERCEPLQPDTTTGRLFADRVYQLLFKL